MTTVLMVRRNDEVAMGADGQVTLGDAVLKGNAVKIRRLYDGKVLVGFAGSVADALALFERFEKHLDKSKGGVKRAAVELAKEWRMDRALRRLEAVMLVAGASEMVMISGTGDVLEPESDVLGTGSGGSLATAAALALMKHSALSAQEIVRESLLIAGAIHIYSNQTIHIETL
jgi:ATP-dependent HslUV protease subunit HslV